MQKQIKEPVLKVVFLGGVGEIGKNMTALEFGEDIILVDCGSTFPNSDTPGVDLVIPDTNYLEVNHDRIKGVVITHGHEDHIGSIGYFLKKINVPVYGTRLTLALIENKLREMKVDNAHLNVVLPGNVIALGRAFKVEFVKVSHSIAGACALAIRTPVGTVFHSGDFKVDFTPIDGNRIDLSRIAEIGKEGVLLLLCESTNVERGGSSMSEATVGHAMRRIFAENPDRRLIIATFASNVHRVQQILDLAVEFKRKVAFSGRSMINIAECASKIGELHYDKEAVVDIEKIKNVDDRDLVIITTGSQGEPMSALTRMASDEFSKVQLGYNDTVIISAHPIPGNERMVYSVINNIYRHGARVIYESLAEVHVSGHACRDELMLLHSLIKPTYFIPVHGEHRHLQKHAELAVSMGMSPANIIIPDIGNCVHVSNKCFKIGENVASGSLLVDGLGVGDSDSVVLRDRKHLSEDGLLIAVVCCDELSGEIIAVEINSRGFVYDNESDAFFSEAKNTVKRALNDMDLRETDETVVKNILRKELKNFIFKKTRRNPMILPMVINC